MTKYEWVERNDFAEETVERFDTASMGGIGTVEKTNEGYLKIFGPVAKEGIYTYKLKNGAIRRELVTMETLMNKDSLETFKMKPVTNQHPQEVLLDSKTVKRRKVGAVGETFESENDKLMVSFMITDSDAVKDAENGRKELSPGYKAKVALEPGIWEKTGERYDAIQVFRDYNHLAMCDKARGGTEIRMNLDGFEAPEDLNNKPKTRSGKKMAIKVIDGISYDGAQEIINLCDKNEALANTEKARADSEAVRADSEKQRADKAEAAAETYKAQLEEAKKVDHTDAINQAAKERVTLLDACKKHMKKEDVEKIDSMSNSEIKKALVASRLPNVNLDSEVRIDTAFEILMSSDVKTPTVGGHQELGQKRFDSKGSGEETVEQAKLDGENYIKDAWKNLDSK